MNETSTPLMLIILDGFGYIKEKNGNAIALANMPNWNEWLSKYPNTLLKASGPAVGLPENYMGNSEVGHLTIGSGRITKSALTKFNEIINDNSFFKNEMLISKLKLLKKDNALHIMGLLSDAGVHCHEEHIFAFVKLAHEIGVETIFVHAFLDGRDTAPKSALKYLKNLDNICQKYSCTMASLHGRFYAMDRDNNWDRTEKSFNILTQKANNQTNYEAEVEQAYSKNETDEFITPISLSTEGVIKDNDGIIFANFREDRARQLAECFINPNFNKFDKKFNLKLSFFISTTRYKEEFNNDIIFEDEKIKNTLLDVLAKYKKEIFIIAETEKYAHVTYFFRGMVDKQLQTEERSLIPSIKLKSYDQKPEMSAPEITEQLLKTLKIHHKDFYLVNYANADMVGHAANLNATIKACECLDMELKKIYEEVVHEQNGILIITSDHGNAEEPNSYHTKNPVPFIVISKDLEGKRFLTNSYSLQDIAPTILNIFKIPQPTEMTGAIIK
ncbi:2,3-bisphosphoglycerate-independent phosphoglycerate mutase [Candidatus Babeliales bacterium]|nr:2,3-bisphosphoglycerate-independent phosphoglycerate mutase [Candidatus Babeliales bacterium]